MIAPGASGVKAPLGRGSMTVIVVLSQAPVKGAAAPLPSPRAAAGHVSSGTSQRSGWHGHAAVGVAVRRMHARPTSGERATRLGLVGR